MDGGSCGGRAKRQRSNSGAGKGVKAVLAAGSKGGVSYFGPPPGGIRAGRPRPTRQAERCPPPPLSGAPWQRVLCGPRGPDSCPERREASLAGLVLPRAWRRVSSPGAALLVGTPSAVPQFGRGLDVGRKARCAAGIPCPTSRQHGTNTTRICSPGKFEQRRPGPRAPPSIPVRGDGGWMCGGWSLAPVRSRRAANTRKE